MCLLVQINRFYQPMQMMNQDEDQQMQALMNNINGGVSKSNVPSQNALPVTKNAAAHSAADVMTSNERANGGKAGAQIIPLPITNGGTPLP